MRHPLSQFIKAKNLIVAIWRLMEAKLNKYLCFRFLWIVAFCFHSSSTLPHTIHCWYTKKHKKFEILSAFFFAFTQNYSLGFFRFCFSHFSTVTKIKYPHLISWRSNRNQKNLSKYWTQSTTLCLQWKNIFSGIEGISYELLLSMDLWFRFLFHIFPLIVCNCQLRRERRLAWNWKVSIF